MTYKETLEKQNKRFKLILDNSERFDYMDLSDINFQFKETEENLKLIKDFNCINEKCFACSDNKICPLGKKL